MNMLFWTPYEYQYGGWFDFMGIKIGFVNYLRPLTDVDHIRNVVYIKCLQTMDSVPCNIVTQ
jgi:hypothetical protein